MNSSEFDRCQILLSQSNVDVEPVVGLHCQLTCSSLALSLRDNSTPHPQELSRSHLRCFQSGSKEIHAAHCYQGPAGTGGASCSGEFQGYHSIGVSPLSRAISACTPGGQSLSAPQRPHAFLDGSSWVLVILKVINYLEVLWFLLILGLLRQSLLLSLK